LSAPSTFLEPSYDTRVKFLCLELPAFVNAGYYNRESPSNRVSWLALLGGEISPPHLHLEPFLQIPADGVEPSKSYLLYSCAPKVSIQVLADDGEPKNPQPLFVPAPTDFMANQEDYISFTLAIPSIDGESLMEKDLVIVPSHQHLMTAEIKRNTSLPYYQHPIIYDEFMACVLLERDLASCMMLEEEITFVTTSDGDAEFTNDDIPFQEDLCIPFGVQLFPHHDEPSLDDIIDNCGYAGPHHDTTPGPNDDDSTCSGDPPFDSIIWSPFSTSLWAHHNDIDLNSLSDHSEGEELVSPIAEVPESTILDAEARIIEYYHSSSSSTKSTLWQDLVSQQESATIANDDPLALIWSHSRK